MTSHLRAIDRKMIKEFSLMEEDMSKAHQNFFTPTPIVLDPLRKNDESIYVLETKSQSPKVVKIWMINRLEQCQGCGVNRLWYCFFFCFKINKILNMVLSQKKIKKVLNNIFSLRFIYVEIPWPIKGIKTIKLRNFQQDWKKLSTWTKIDHRP